MGLINVNDMYLGKGKRISRFYHYTSSEALINIIKDSSIRFTHCGFLNDIEEYRYINEVLQAIISENVDEEVSSFIKSMLKEIDQDYKGIILDPIDNRFRRIANGYYYVLSGTSDSDSTSMWCYYVKNNAYCGYAIQFDVRRLYNYIKHLLPINGEFLYGNVIYNAKLQKNIIIKNTRRIFSKYEHEIENGKWPDDVIEALQDEFFDFIQRIRLFFKREGFEKENELRLVVLTDTKGKPEGYFKTDFTATNGLIKPYIEYKFPDKLLPVKEIKLSPTIDKDIGENGIEYLLKSKDYIVCTKPNKRVRNVLITRSAMKLRF